MGPAGGEPFRRRGGHGRCRWGLISRFTVQRPARKLAGRRNDLYPYFMTDRELLDYLDAAQEAARRGAAVLEDWRTRFSVREKGRADLVTDADFAAQQATREYLLGRFPGHAFLGEEDGPNQPRPPAGAPPTWIVDPLDGTTNYVHDAPMYCVSVGLEVAGELVAGAIFDPRQREMFAAARGHGAMLNDRPIRTSTTNDLADALLSTGFSPD